MNNKLRIAALSIAATFICATTADCSYDIYNGKKTVSNDNIIAEEMFAEIVNAEQSVSVIEQLAYACREKNADDISSVCDMIMDEMDAAKEEVAAYALDINEWASDEIKARQEKHENELNVKYAQTASALTELRNGINTEKNLEIICSNFTNPNEYHKSDAAPNNETSAKTIEDESGSMNVKAVAINSPAPTDDDLKYDGNSEIPEIITILAEALNDPNRIYLFVKNNIRTEAYTGSKKEALITLSQSGGNDIDQAALLIALFRAQKIPARYVTGTVQITAEQSLEITGAMNINAALLIFASGYRNAKSISKNGDIIGFKMTRTWVEAYIPYTDYRGAGNMGGDRTWIQLDPSFKKLESTVENFEAEYSDNDKAIFDMINKTSAENREDFDESVSIPDKIAYYYNDIQTSSDAYIPASLPYTALSVDERYSFIKDTDKDSISISIGYEDILSAHVSELYGRSVIIDFEPASSYDQEVIDKYEKLTDVPAYLVNVVPVVTVGDKKYKGTEECSLGSAHEMIISINVGGNSNMLRESIFSGSMYALNLDLQSITPDEARAIQIRMENAEENYTLKNAFTTKELGAFLDCAGKYYFSLCDLMDGLFAAEMNIDRTRRLGLAITGYQFARNVSFGNVRSLEPGSFYIDVAYNSSSVVSLEGNRDLEKNFTLSSGMTGSYFEGYIWEQLIDSDKTCISTISVMNAAAQKGIQFSFLTPENVESQLAKSNIKDSVKNEIRNFINQGFYVKLVPETLTIGDWTGTAYIAIDMNTGSASYMISGGTAGGGSMVFNEWDAGELFKLNNILFLTDLSISFLDFCNSLRDFYYAQIFKDTIDGILSIHGIVGSVHSIVSACDMRDENYNFFVESQSESFSQGDMESYSLFTLQNLIYTVVNTAFSVATTIYRDNDKVKAVLSLLRNGCNAIGGYPPLVDKVKEVIMKDINDGKLDSSNHECVLCCIWDWVGFLFSLLPFQ